MEGSRTRLLVDAFERRDVKGLLGMTAMPGEVDAVNESRRESLFDELTRQILSLKKYPILPERASQRRVPGRFSEFYIMYRRYRGSEVTPLRHPPHPLRRVMRLRCRERSRGRRHLFRSVVTDPNAPFNGRISTNTNHWRTDGRTVNLNFPSPLSLSLSPLLSFSVARMGGFNSLYRIESIRETMGVDDVKDLPCIKYPGRGTSYLLSFVINTLSLSCPCTDYDDGLLVSRAFSRARSLFFSCSQICP